MVILPHVAEELKKHLTEQEKKDYELGVGNDKRVTEHCSVCPYCAWSVGIPLQGTAWIIANMV